MTIVTGNDINPLFYFAEYFILYANQLTDMLLGNNAGLDYTGSETGAESGFWLDTFGDVFEAYHTQFIYTATPMVEWIKWLYEEYNPIDFVSDFYSKWIPIILGFEPECPGIHAGMAQKIMKLSFLIPSWIGFLIANLIRLIALIIYSIFYLL